MTTISLKTFDKHNFQSCRGCDKTIRAGQSHWNRVRYTPQLIQKVGLGFAYCEACAKRTAGAAFVTTRTEAQQLAEQQEAYDG